jgi:GMP synthase-like glutamine amidotransferase
MDDTMKLHYIQHVPFENSGNIEAWAKANGHSVTKTVLYYDEAFPEPGEYDWLVIMGGPMNVYEEKDYPFLKREKAFIKDAIAKKKRVLGVCLGAQLLSDVLGGKVTANANKEIGWFKVKLTPEAKQSPVFKNLPQEFNAFHWHGGHLQHSAGRKAHGVHRSHCEPGLRVRQRPRGGPAIPPRVHRRRHQPADQELRRRPRSGQTHPEEG